jgi:hypothetical protein
MNYKNVTISDKSFRQIIHPQSSSYLEKSNLVTCLNEQVKLKIFGKGVGPWKVSYRILYNDKMTYSKEIDIKKDVGFVEVAVDVGENYGVYDLELVKVVDGNGCERVLEDSENNSRHGRSNADGKL